VAGDPVRGHAHGVLCAQGLVAGAAHQQLALALEERGPCGVVPRGVGVPVLLDHAGGVDRDLALVGVEVLDAARLRGGLGGHGGLLCWGRANLASRRLDIPTLARSRRKMLAVVAAMPAMDAISLRRPLESPAWPPPPTSTAWTCSSWPNCSATAA